MTVTRLAAVAARGRGQVDDGLAGDGPCPVQPPPLGPAPGGRGGLPATECGRRWRTWPGSTCRWGSRTWGG